MSETHDPTPNSRGYAWLVLVLLLLLYLLNYADRYVAVGLLDQIKETFEISDTYMGFLVGPAFAIIYTVFAIPIARFADKHNRVRIIAAGAVMWSGFTVLTGLSQTPTMFALARIGVGIGEAAFLAPAFSILADYFPPKKRAFAFAMLNFGVYFGQIFGLVGGAQIAAAYDWRMAFFVLGAPGILLAVITLILLKEPKRGRLEDKTRTVTDMEHSFMFVVRALFARPSFRRLAIGTALGGFASYGFGYWAPTMFARAFSLTTEAANARYGFPAFVAGLTGAIVIGILCDRLSSKDARWPFRLAAIGLVGFFATMIVLCFTSSVNLATALTLPAGLLAGGWVIAMQAALQDLLPAKPRATGTAIWGFCLAFTGMVLGVWIVGVMNDVFQARFGEQAIRYSMAITLSATLPSALFLWLAGKNVDEDRKILAEQFA